MNKVGPAAAALAILAAACGGGGTPETTVTTAATTTTTTSTESGAVNNLEGVRSATIRIVASGTFMDPEFGEQVNAAGSGSGFLIDESGIAVTNNHVVTGSAFLDVFIDGEDEPRNARVLGVSECSDLAVIDVDGEGFPFLAWYEGSVTTGLEIYAAGYPLGTEEYTLLDGIISKEDAGGETSWSSIDSVIEHSADTLPGNSGGPLVTADGKVVGVNYAGDSAGQSFGIGLGEVQRVLDRLMEGNDVTSVGINGTAVAGDSFTGIWVASVKSGSPAHVAGVEAGDVVTRLEGLLMAEDGTMSDYCDILRSHSPSDPLTVEVLRFSTEEVYEGVLNGTPLALSFSFAQELAEEAPTDGGETVVYDNYVEVTDDSGAISISIPGAWSDISGIPWERDGEVIGVSIVAAPDLQGWYDTWEVPGVFFGASRSLIGVFDEAALLDSIDFGASCTFDSRTEYADALYTGSYDLWVDCDGLATTMVVVAAVPEDRSFIMLLEVIAVSDADFDALDTILNTFIASGDF